MCVWLLFFDSTSIIKVLFHAKIIKKMAQNDVSAPKKIDISFFFYFISNVIYIIYIWGFRLMNKKLNDIALFLLTRSPL